MCYGEHGVHDTMAEYSAGMRFRTVISRLVTPAFLAAGGPRSVAAANWESRFPDGGRARTLAAPPREGARLLRPSRTGCQPVHPVGLGMAPAGKIMVRNARLRLLGRHPRIILINFSQRMAQCSHPVWDRDRKKLCHSSFSSTDAKCAGLPASHTRSTP